MIRWTIFQRRFEFYNTKLTPVFHEWLSQKRWKKTTFGSEGGAEELFRVPGEKLSKLDLPRAVRVQRAQGVLDLLRRRGHPVVHVGEECPELVEIDVSALIQVPFLELLVDGLDIEDGDASVPGHGAHHLVLLRELKVEGAVQVHR